jgi:RTX calcium-binding nonapeptide repeat (4 copies)
MPSQLRTFLAILGAASAAALAGPLAGEAQSPAQLCQPPESGVNCGPGNNRKAAGGAGVGKVPHNDGAGRTWPALSGILWQVMGAGDRAKDGGPGNDELLGHHGSDRLSGRGGHDIIWGDWDPNGNTTRQRDQLFGGAGNDWLYPSHGRSLVFGGPGSDYVWAFYGKGTIDCGPGIDTVRIRTGGAFRTRNCERIRHFCAHGENRRGQCLSPTGKPVTAARRGG